MTKYSGMVYRMEPLGGEMLRVLGNCGLGGHGYIEGVVVLNGRSYMGGEGMRVMVTSMGKMPLGGKMVGRRGGTLMVLEFTESSWLEVCDFEKTLGGSMVMELLCRGGGIHRYVPLCNIYTGCEGGHVLFGTDIYNLGDTCGGVKIYRVGGRVILVASIGFI